MHVPHSGLSCSNNDGVLSLPLYILQCDLTMYMCKVYWKMSILCVCVCVCVRVCVCTSVCLISSPAAIPLSELPQGMLVGPEDSV